MMKHLFMTFFFFSLLTHPKASKADLVDMTDVNGDPYAILKSEGLSEHIAVHELHVESVPAVAEQISVPAAPLPTVEAKAEAKAEAEPDFFSDDIL